jgi:hypothetical protein
MIHIWGKAIGGMAMSQSHIDVVFKCRSSLFFTSLRKGKAFVSDLFGAPLTNEYQRHRIGCYHK